MNSKFSKTVSVIAIAILMISTFSVLTSVFAVDHVAVSMWLDPDDVSLDTGAHSVGYKFVVTAWLNATGAGNIGAWQFKMLYNKNQLKIVSVTLTGTGMSEFFENSGTTGNFVPPIDYGSYDGTRDYALIGESWLTGPYGTGCGSLVDVEFEVIAVPPKGGQFDSLIDISTCFTAAPGKGDTYALNPSLNNVVDYAYDCSFTFEWLTPPFPYLAVVPQTQSFGPYENLTGKLVDVDIFIYALDAAWYLVNASFTFNYNSTLLVVNETTIDTSSWDVAGTAVVTDGTIDFYVETSQSLSGTVKVADVTFEIIYQGDYPDVDVSPLTFSSVSLYDHEIVIPTLDPLEGEIEIKGLLGLPLPHLEVVPKDTVLGPEPSMGEEFSVDVVMKGLVEEWELIGYDFRLSYCDDMLEVVSVERGPFLEQANYGKFVLEDLTMPEAEAPLWAAITHVVLKVVTESEGTYTFTLDAPEDILIMIDGAITNSFTIVCGPTPMVTWKVIEIRNYKTYPVTGDYVMTVTPNSYGVHVAGSFDIEYYWALDWNNTIYPTWWDWLNGTIYDGDYYPHHWDWMDWWVTEGSLTTKTFGEIWDCTNLPLLYNDTGAGDYLCFWDNCEMCDLDLVDIHNDPDFEAIIPWLRNTGTPPCTWFFSAVESTIYGPHVVVGEMLASDSGEWHIFPEGDGVLATITFRAIKQAAYPGGNLTCNLTLFNIGMIDKDGEDIFYDPPEDGTYTILAYDLPGRQIDLYTQYPDGFNGKGLNEPSDMFWPQKEVILYAYVTYNWWPVQNKPVGYEIIDAQGEVWAKRTALSNGTGIAEVSFRMPWPCDDPELLFGVWTVVATVDIACTVVTDTLTFHYDWLANIIDVTPSKYICNHDDTIEIDVTIESHAMQDYDVTITVTLYDELGFPFAFGAVEIPIGGAEYCTPNEYTVTFTIEIPKYAAAGIATIHVCCFDKEPSEGGCALCPEYEPTPEIFIEPY
jgi:hypothetical protein